MERSTRIGRGWIIPYDDRDLAATIDFRDVLGEIVRYRLGNAALGEVFPGYSVVDRGVVVH